MIFSIAAQRRGAAALAVWQTHLARFRSHQRVKTRLAWPPFRTEERERAARKGWRYGLAEGARQLPMPPAPSRATPRAQSCGLAATTPRGGIPNEQPQRLSRALHPEP